MPDVSAKKFVETFQRAFAKSGRLSEKDLSALKKAKEPLANPTQRAAAERVLSMVRGDRELDAFEVAPMRKAMQVLAGVSGARLPADLERALANAVPVSNVAVKSYDLTFDVSGTGPDFPAKAVVTLERAAGKESILEVNPDRLDISSVKAGGKPVKFSVKNGRLHVTAPGAKAIEIQYTVKAVDASQKDAFGLIRDKYTGRMWTLTWPYNTGALFPSNSDPADGSSCKVTVKVANGFSALGPGTEVSRGTFDAGGEAPAYGASFYTAKDFVLGDGGTSRDGVKVKGFGLASGVPTATRAAYLATAKRSLDYYTSYLGDSGYGTTMNLVEVKGELDGMENTCSVCIMLAATGDKDTANETSAHEVGHHWFGNNVRIASWGDFWMSEGFNSYITYRFLRADEGEARFYGVLDRDKECLRDDLEANPHSLSAPPNTDVAEIFDSVPYALGPWVLRMMEVQLGTPKFDALLKDWYQAKKQSAVSTKDFVTFAKAKTGKDFSAFFEAWGNIKAVPSFRADVKTSATEVTATLSTSTPFPKGLTIPLRLEGAGGRSMTVQVDPTKPFKVTPGFRVTKTTWDPERTVLALVQ